MKKKMFVSLLSFTLIASMVCGCGNKTNQSAAAERNSTAAEPVEITDENAIKETETTTEAEDNKESETVSETTPAPAPAQSSEVILDKQESGEETENSKEPEEGSAVSTDQTAAATPAPAEAPTQETENPRCCGFHGTGSIHRDGNIRHHVCKECGKSAAGSRNGICQGGKPDQGSAGKGNRSGS